MRVRRRLVWSVACLAVVLCTGFTLAQTVAPSARAQPGCSESVVNGGFENNTGWVAGADLVPPQYTTAQAHTGGRSMLMGIPPGVPNQRSSSSIRQTISIPANATSAILSFWYLALLPGPPNGDYGEFVVYASDGATPMSQSWRGFVSNDVWNQATFDLAGYRGQPIQIYFNVYNDGIGATGAMYLDDVSLVACGGTAIPSFTLTPSPTGQYGPPSVTPRPTNIVPTLPPVEPTTLPPPSPWPTVSPPPQPEPLPPVEPPFPGCLDVVANGNFEAGFANWYAPPNRILPQLVYQPVRGGALAVQLGSQATNINSYSSIRQPVTIPGGYPAYWLEFWTWTWAGSPGGADRQEVDFLAPNSQVLQKFWRVLSNDQTWVQHVYGVNNYAGRSVQVYLNAYNDGANAPAGMVVDEVHIWACNPNGAEPYTYAQPAQGSAALNSPPPAETTAPPAPIAAAATPLPLVQISPTMTLTLPALATAPIQAIPLAPRSPLPNSAGPPTVTSAPLDAAIPTVTANVTVLSLLVTPTSTPFAPAAGAVAVVTGQVTPGTRAPVSVIVVAPTATPRVSAVDQIGQALHLPPGWPLGLLGIIVIVLLLILVLRR